MHTLMTIFSQPPSNLRDPKLALWNSPWAMVTSGVRETSTADGRRWLKYTSLKSRNARCIHPLISIQEVWRYFTWHSCVPHHRPSFWSLPLLGHLYPWKSHGRWSFWHPRLVPATEGVASSPSAQEPPMEWHRQSAKKAGKPIAFHSLALSELPSLSSSQQ